MTSLRRLISVVAAGALVASLAACDGPPPTITQTPTPSLSEQPSITPTGSAAPSAAPSGSVPPASSTPDATATSPAPGSPPPKSPPSKSTAPPSKPSASSAGHWKPKKGTTWQWQLSGKLNLSVKAQVYDVDLFDTSAAQVKQLHAKGRRVICYFSAGSYESGRPDSSAFPAAVKGNKMDGWPEYWLDIRDSRVLTLMAARMDLCAKKGFDGVEPDNVDGYQNDAGFPLTAANQATFNRALAKLAHARGLAVGLKNDLDQVASLQPSFDFAVNEQCAEYDECSALKPFTSAGKPVFHVEYNLPLSSFCPTTRALGFSSMLKDLDLDATRTPCPA